MFRWVLAATGAAIMYVSFTAWSDLDPRPADATPIDLNEAIESVQRPGVRFIKLPAMLDTTRRIHDSGLAAPAFAAHPPHEVQPLTPTGKIEPEHVQSLLGCQVQVAGPLDPKTVVIESLRYEQDEQTEQQTQVVMGHRVLAPLAGSEGLVLVLSPMMDTDSGDDRPWFAKPLFTGQLSPLKDLGRNIALPVDWAAIVKKLSTMGVDVPNDAVVIMTERRPATDLKGSTTARHYIPVAGSDESIFVVTTGEQELQAADGFVGILEHASRDSYLGFESILGADLPKHIGLLRLVSEDPAQQQARLIVNVGFGSSVAMIGLSLLLIYRAHRRKLRELELCEQALLQPKRDTSTTKKSPKAKPDKDTFVIEEEPETVAATQFPI